MSSITDAQIAEARKKFQSATIGLEQIMLAEALRHRGSRVADLLEEVLHELRDGLHLLEEVLHELRDGLMELQQ